MCMHTHKKNSSDLTVVIHSIETMDDWELAEVQAAINRRRGALKQSTVVERRDYRHGVLQLEGRAYRRKDGGQTRRGPYWYFHYREGGKQRTLYVGKTDTPEVRVNEIMEGSNG